MDIEELEVLINKMKRLYIASLANDTNSKLFSALASELSKNKGKFEHIHFCVELSNAYFNQNMRNLKTMIDIKKKIKEQGIDF